MNHRKLVVGLTIGGSAWALMRGQLRWFREQGWDVTLVTSPGERAKQTADREGVPVRGIPMHRGLSPAKDVVALMRWVLLLRKERPDAVNVGTPKAALLGGIAAWLTGVKRRLYVVRGLRLEGSTGPTARLLWAMEWLSHKLATDVLYVSRSLAQEAERRGLTMPGKSWLIGSGSSNGVDAEKVRARAGTVDAAELRSRLGLGAEDFVVGFIGRIAADKGVEMILDAAANPQLPANATFLLIGSTDDPALAARVSAQPDRIRAVGWTDDVWGHLAIMDVLCLPTRREGFPNVVLEAAAVGVPTITTRATGAIDSVVPEVTGLLVDVDDADAMTQAIRRLASDPELASTLGQAAQRRVDEEFRPEQIWSGVAEILSGEPAPVHAARFTTKGDRS
ncbi:glycosyltransferase family 4 protein [Parenemella sanctibonifatiensis]|uniref:Glycosyltransferase family 1 protein n=1 Tax=Parenemella sanctibonifatiensis TaxID=2016505 RepID=A0A255EF03_9ACTN|nr:glycosyltransferase family 4 protein [Parenemella sanctibonifatiensis]OYN87982.1 glycosyltransferase family 1 protein [Parenemella sanctibonifatiensis]